MVAWEEALEAFLTEICEDVTWILVGSAATGIHGAEVNPGDVDILAHPETPDGIMKRAMLRFIEPSFAAPPTDDPETLLSSRPQPLLAVAEGWIFGRTMIEGCKLEFARIRHDVGPTVLLETIGSAVWETHETTTWRGHVIPIVPFEVQLATIVSRGLDAARTRLIERGFDTALLARALTDRGVA